MLRVVVVAHKLKVGTKLKKNNNKAPSNRPPLDIPYRFNLHPISRLENPVVASLLQGRLSLLSCRT